MGRVSSAETGGANGGVEGSTVATEAVETVEVVEVNEHAEAAIRLLNGDVELDNLEFIDRPEVDKVERKTRKNHHKTLYISELLIGHRDSAGDFYDKVVEQIAALPKEMQPDSVVLGGLLMGDFKHQQKPRRVTLAPGMDSMNTQFAEARQRIQQLLDLKIPVTYNMSPDDHRIALEYTVEVFREIHKLAQEVGYATQDKMKAHPQWQAHLAFQNQVVFPYCLHAGRRLNEGEYFRLWDAHHGGEVKGLDKAALAGKNFKITDDVNITTTTRNGEYSEKVRAYMGFSPESQYQDPLKPAVQWIENAEANGVEIPDSLVLQHNHELVGINYGDSWLLSTGAAFDATKFIDKRGSVTDARGDISRRLNTTRRRVHPPSVVMQERHDDGRVIFTVMNESLMEKADSIGRMVILLTCDHQIGSITARPELLLKEIDMFRQRAQQVGHSAIQFAGDMSHGRNYSDFPSESQSTGLMSMDSQLRFNQELWRRAMDGMTRDEWDRVQSILIQPGNHEWNSGTTKWHGYSFVDNHINAFNLLLADAGYQHDERKAKVLTHDAVTTGKGEVAKSYTGIERYGDYTMLNKHFLLDRGGKGSTGGSPIYQTPAYVNGLADLAEDLDLLGVGHWHHGAFGAFGNKLGFIAPSKAGLSGYEADRGYRPRMGSLMIHLGGGLPVELEYVSERALHNHVIKAGEFSEAGLKAEGLKTDEGFNALKHGLRMGREFPKSRLQKAVFEMEHDLSNRVDTMAYFQPRD